MKSFAMNFNFLRPGSSKRVVCEVHCDHSFCVSYARIDARIDVISTCAALVTLFQLSGILVKYLKHLKVESIFLSLRPGSSELEHVVCEVACDHPFCVTYDRIDVISTGATGIISPGYTVSVVRDACKIFKTKHLEVESICLS